MIVVSIHSWVAWGHLGLTLGHFEPIFCHLGRHLGATLAHLVDTLKPGAHFGPLCSWNARLCYIILSKEMTKYRPSKLSARQKISDGTSFLAQNFGPKLRRERQESLVLLWENE